MRVELSNYNKIYTEEVGISKGFKSCHSKH